MICEKCGKENDGSYGSGRFCSSFCARSFSSNKTDDIKRKIGKGVSNSEIYWNSVERRYGNNTGIKQPLKVPCKTCGTEIGRRTKTGLCSTCLRQTDEYKNKMKELRKKEIEAGTFKGWQSRNILSYPEKFWIKVLKNNDISFKGPNIKVGKYFLDFLIEINEIKIDLEIDGKQHEYEDRKENDKRRDEYLESLSYIIYRISWNEINSDQGKLKMKKKISDFLKFIKIF